MTRRRIVILLAVVLSMIAAACGGGDSASDDGTTTTTTSDSGSTGNDTTTTTEPERASGDSGSDYCERVRAAQDGEEDSLDFNLFGRTPAEIEAQFEANLEIFEGWRDLAPDAIKDDADVLLEAFRTIVDRGKELEWDLEAMAADEVFNNFDEPAISQATANLDAYSRDVCGVDFSVSADPGTAPPSGNGDEDDPITIALNFFQLPAGFFSEEDVQCLRDELGSEFEASITPGWVPTQDDINLLLDALDACEIGIAP